jgi:DNA-binding transcriptional LysR family regulator
MSSNSGETLKQLCLAGNGIACLSDYMVDKEIASGSLSNCWPTNACRLKCRSARFTTATEPSRIRAFIDFLSEHVKQLPKELS